MVIERRRKPPSALSFLIEVLWRCFTISKKEMPINEEIREKEIRVIGPDGAALGIMSSKEALQIAQRENLDLVNISPKAVPPVCKICLLYTSPSDGELPVEDGTFDTARDTLRAVSYTHLFAARQGGDMARQAGVAVHNL